MANSKNAGQFGNRSDTAKQAHKGGQASTGSFGSKHSADPAAAGRKGAAAQPSAAKSRGGQHSHGSR